MSGRYTILTFLLLLFCSSFSIGAEPLYDKGNDLYKAGKFNEAAAHYEQLISTGRESAELYFNLGNAYFKVAQIPKAILYYEKASKLDPFDEDIKYNLRLANMRVVDRIVPVPVIFYKRWGLHLMNSFSSSVWAWICIILCALLSLSAGLFFISYVPLLKKSGFLAAIISFVLLASCLLMAFKRHELETGRHYAIIFSPSVYIKSSPDAQSTDLFILHEGTKVKIEDTIGNWVKVKLANGNIGWMEDKHFQTI